ncbi:MAG TPA: hypothetical protein VMP42_10465 [Actinomycetota bacterium]|nr:hypothetical protein [Actinomycetota bacterium]
MSDEDPRESPPERATPPEREGTDTWVAILLASAAVVAAALGGRAALLSDRGSDTYTAAIRQHAQQAASTVENIRYVYDDEAGFALRATISEVRAEALREEARGARGLVRTALLEEARAQEQVAEIVSGASLAATDEYRLEDGGYDLAARLADVAAENPDLLEVDPDAPEEEAFELARHASIAISATVPVSLAFMFGALSQAYPSRRRWFLYAGSAFLVGGLIFGVVLEVVL